ncbi:pentapeptide repeat-containing protein [Pseudonocardia kunmingensis]|uniref:Pentapeptide repeat protein n=1 Tax=Pseudonocardia kunmingensis TaxID=630975 RepID=A0A543E444_9PSEU|nr:pentapeptide repeat-containing protein [Pseudonocardia kunmingensis]TQM16378.1 pentapeptide repeat protein [Pseudonocardia kunmingensis]
MKRRPEPPDLPEALEPAPGVVGGGAVWDCVEAGADVRVPEHVAGLRVQESRWVGGSLAGVRFTGLECRDTEFVQCDLSGAVLDSAVLSRVVFTDCRLTGTVLDGAQLTDVRISDSAADLLSLRMARARFVLVENSGLHAADLYEFDGEHCAFLGCDLGEASVEAARLRETDLHGCTVDGLRGALALRGARISPDQIVPLAAALLDELGVQVTEQPPKAGFA